ncbi:hypothetical protein BC831DRAFT_241658 [Entophlyctis helioformis]|nr:hypothetical protein BC831DRAFT_241658 [Entophlyctis helioformis]
MATPFPPVHSPSSPSMSAPADCAVLAQAFPSAFGNVANCCTLSTDTARVGCTNGRVTSITVQSAGLTGQLPETLGSLTELIELDLSVNSLTGPIPSWLGNLSKLVKLQLSINQLSGTIPPSLSSLSQLELLSLVDNKLTGSIPASFTNLASLKSL